MRVQCTMITDFVIDSSPKGLGIWCAKSRMICNDVPCNPHVGLYNTVDTQPFI